MLDRRMVLASGLTALCPVALVSTPGAATVADELTVVTERWRRMLTGGEALPVSAELQGILAAIDARTTRLVDSLQPDGGVGALWPDLTGGDERRTTSALQRLRLMSIAHATSRSAHHGSAPLAAAIQAALERISKTQYFPGAAKRGNWWDWEIGTPLRLLDVLVLMRARLPEPLTEGLLAAVEHFTPRAGYMHQTGAPQPATGANRAWISSVRAGRSLLRRDAEGLRLARDSILPALQFTTEGDGVYRDGSFIQHGDIASTGAYGTAFSFLVADFLALLQGSRWALTAEEWAPMLRWIETGVLPVMHRGGAMDMTRSRSISRSDVQDQESGLVFLLALCRMSEVAPADHAMTLKRFIKHTIETDTAMSVFDIDIDAPGFQMTLDHARIAALIMRDPTVSSLSPAPAHFQFAGMDRVVHRRLGFTLGIAMYSSRVANFEAINGQNKRGWYTGHGMTYVYNDDLQHYRDGYWPTVDALRLPGVTSDGRPTTHQTRSPESWVGGAALDQDGVVGMRARYNEGPVEAAKSWFCFGDRIICLGGDIRGPDGVTLETTIENRRLSGGLRPTGLSVEGAPLPTLGQAIDISPARWLHLPGTGGVLLGLDRRRPHGMRVRGLLESRTGDWRSIDELNADATPFSRDYATVWIDHGPGPVAGGYGYVLLPGASEAETRRQSAQARLEVVAEGSAVHAVRDRDQGLFAANVWADAGATAGPVRASNACAVIIREEPGRLLIGVSDPTQSQDRVRLAVQAPAARPGRLDPRARVETDGQTAFISVDTAGAAGATALVELLIGAAPTRL